MKSINVFIFLLMPLIAQANTIEHYQFQNVEQHDTFQVLLKELRCLVCQNQNLLDSNATLAVDLKNKIYQSVLDNQSEQDIKAYLVKRYGDFILFNPPVNQNTYVLWFMPLMMLVIGLMVLFSFMHRRVKDA